MFYIIKQVLNEPPGWTRILKFWTRWQQKEPCRWQSLCVVLQKKTHLGNLEIEHVSPIVAFVCNHMLLWLWLSQLHWEDPCIVFRLLDMRTWNPTWVLEDKLAMVHGRTLWKDFVTFSICQYSILVSTNPVATGGNKMGL